MTVTWNPADTGFATFSNANLTLTTATGAGVNWSTTRATQGFAAGKYYFENHIDANSGAFGFLGIGVANAAQPTNNFLGNVASQGMGDFPQGPNVLPAGTANQAVAGAVVCVAVDIGNRSIWFRTNGGNWNASGTADPATNTGGIGISAVTGTLYAAVSLNRNSGDPAAALTTNFGAAAFAFAKPVGFIGMDAPAAGTIALSPASVVAGSTGNVIAVTGVATAFTGTPFSVTGGYGAFMTAQSVAGATSGSITLNPGAQGYGPLTVTDAVSGATASIAVTTPGLGALKIGFIGDSITALDSGQAVTSAAAVLTAAGYTVTTVNRGVNSTATADWVGGSANLIAAKAAFASAGVSLVHIMLGTNDASSAHGLTAAQHHANMASIVADLVAAGYGVVISKPLWTMPNANHVNPAETWPNDPNTLYHDGFALDMQSVDGVHVFQGDTAGFAAAALSPATFLRSDGIHPATAAQSAILGSYWGTAILQRFGNAAGGVAGYRGGFRRTA